MKILKFLLNDTHSYRLNQIINFFDHHMAFILNICLISEIAGSDIAEKLNQFFSTSTQVTCFFYSIKSDAPSSHQVNCHFLQLLFDISGTAGPTFAKKKSNAF